MKIRFLIATAIFTIGASIASAQSYKADGKVLTLVSAHEGPVINSNHPDVIASENKSGFETGQVVKLDGVYHMFINEMFGRAHLDMRIAYWTSTDAINWKRQGTVVNSIPNRTGDNPRSEVWVTAVQFNEEENAWNIFYVAYRAGDAAKGELPGSDYAGRIWRAKSVITGKKGIAGPYADLGIVLEPGKDSQSWEGQQAVASFSPYKTDHGWFAIYDGHFHTPKGPWPDGMAFSNSLSGPWTRMPEGFNPISIVDTFAENHVVSRLKDGRFLAVFDSLGDQEIGYSTSDDGVAWQHETRVKVQFKDKLWTPAGDHVTRTPLCAIEENDGTFTVIYTAIIKVNDKNFYAVGECSLAWK